MEIPEELRQLVDRLGQALVQALVTDGPCRDLARQIQDGGYEVGLMIEATLALHRREDETARSEDGEETQIIQLQVSDMSTEMERSPHQGAEWSADDRAFLQKFKIALD